MATSSTPTTSIVIATADRPDMLRDCIGSWRDQVPPAVELVIVDAGQDAPVDEAATKALWPETRVIRSPVRNAGAQRNAGVRAARGDIIIFLDDDTLVNAGWWEALTAPLAAPADALACIAGAVWCNRAPRLTDQRGGYVNWRGEVIQITHRSAEAPREVDWPMTTNMAVTREAFERVGGFSDLFGVYDEDVDFGLLLRQAGYRIHFEPNAAAYHRYRERPARPPTKESRFRDGHNRALLLARHYGLGPRTLVFLTLAPLLQLAAGTRAIAQATWQALGHATAYCLGTLAGLKLGLTNRPRGDGGVERETWDVGRGT